MKKLRKFLPLIVPVAFILSSVTFSPSCANTTTPPTGGKKDTIPPVIIGIKPLPGTVNVPVNAQIVFEFNEFFTMKDPRGVYLSPPQLKAPKFRIRGRSLVVYFEENLLENTTYTLTLTDALADNNEGNKFPGYSLTFSTGDKIDEMVLTGTVRDCNTLQPLKGATVLLYKDLSDSAVFKHRPDAAVQTDAWGYFALRNVADTLYRLYAIVDESANNVYDPDNDKIAFIDSILRPTIKVADDLPELLKYDMEDTVHCMARKSEHELVMFREKPSKQLIVNKKRLTERSAYLTFMAPGAQIDSIWAKGIPSRRLIMQFNPERDSLELWINDPRRQSDTLHLFVDYMKTDSSGTLSPFTEHLRLTSEKKTSTSKSSRRNLKHDDTTCVFKLTATAENVEQYGFQFEFTYPVIKEGFKQIELKSINPRQQEELMKFSVTRDSTNLRKYTLMPEGKLQKGYNYLLKVPHRQFRDINGYYNDSTEVKVALPNDDKLSSLSLELTSVHNNYIIDLLNEKRDKTIRSFHISSDTTLLFPYLSKGKYSVRITEDKNANGLVDTGNVLEHRLPEKVRFFTLKNGSYVINVMESSEITQKIDLEKLFKD